MYFKINDTDYSMYVSKLAVEKQHNYKSQTNSAGNTVIKMINSKWKVEVGIIPLDGEVMSVLLADITPGLVDISFRNPETNELVEGVSCFIEKQKVEYYTIHGDNARYKAFTIQIVQL